VSPRVRKFLTRLLAAAGAAVLAFVLVGIPLYIAPVSDEAQPTDVVFILGPATTEDIVIARAMLAEGLSHNLLLSVGPPNTRSPELRSLCTTPQVFTVECEIPSPSTTQGEARMLQTAAAQHGWTSATVITQTAYVTRSRLIISRCFTGDLRLIADQAPLGLRGWAQQYLYQSGAFLKAAFVTNTC
jgi:hypothetical protein